MTAIIVESDHPKYPIVARYTYRIDASQAIKDAEKLIEDLNTGRKTLKGILK